jgi:hypothetical protein
VNANHYLANAFKRRRWWYSRQITEVYNFPQQSNAADMMYEALVQVANDLPKGASIRLTVHDELVLNVPKDVVRQAWDAVKAGMERTWPQIVEASASPETVRHFYPNGWFCPADMHLGLNWKMAKSKDPDDKKARVALEKSLGVGGH